MGRLGAAAATGEVIARLDARRQRASRLADRHPSSAEMLRFYHHIAGLQQTLLRNHPDVLNAAEGEGFGGRLHVAAAVDLVPLVIQWLQTRAPANIRTLAATLYSTPLPRWQAYIDRGWREGGADREPADVIEAFAVELLLQPFAESAALVSTHAETGEHGERTTARCPCCGGLPIAATLRERAHGAARALVCGLCQTEWGIHRLVCPACGEQRADALETFKADELPAVRIDACNSCRIYVKTLDLTVDGTMLPIVDDLATLAADIWAAEQDYEKLRPNLLRL